MENTFINLDLDNLKEQHLCCAIGDKKHQEGVEVKKKWLEKRILEGHVFRKLDARGKVFIEYTPIEKAWASVEGNNYLYIYCLWVSGSYKKQGYAKELLEYCIEDAKQQGKNGVCIISSKKKKPFLADKKFLLKYDFEVIDSIDEYELLALSFNDEEKPSFSKASKKMKIEDKTLTVYYAKQCPYIPNCLLQMQNYTQEIGTKLEIIAVDSVEQARTVPGVFNNWSVFYQGEFNTLHLLNEGYLKKLIEK